MNECMHNYRVGYKGPSIYDVHTEGEGVRLRWTQVDGGRVVKPHVDVHAENYN